MKIPLTRLARILQEEKQRTQQALDRWLAEYHMRRLIHFSQRWQKDIAHTRPMLDCHCYRLTLQIAFNAYSLKNRQTVLYGGKPGILTRWFRTWRMHQVVIKIHAASSKQESHYDIFIDGRAIKEINNNVV
ncbi:hypothetical protein B4923_06840 [Brenneria roseae subsp. americana]|uniref:Uncharacterized protein n=1 Tax=Brenneria roseae subsp. americana TaxID=1508507 RepID=A0A2U1TW71_9GAMM|nr:hypothetical protein [Brenneria roseae]PWC13658.1 hypothetical protein B4923_06840 [Brenneria roseae subsp. americana]